MPAYLLLACFEGHQVAFVKMVFNPAKFMGWYSSLNKYDQVLFDYATIYRQLSYIETDFKKEQEGAKGFLKSFRGDDLVGLQINGNMVQFTDVLANVSSLERGEAILNVIVSSAAIASTFIPSKASNIIPQGYLAPGTAAHKAARWSSYSGTWPYERWSKVYDANMINSSVPLQRKVLYRNALNGTNKVINTPFGKRQIDIAVENERLLVQLKTGKAYLTATGRHSNTWAIQRDAWLVSHGDCQGICRLFVMRFYLSGEAPLVRFVG